MRKRCSPELVPEVVRFPVQERSQGKHSIPLPLRVLRVRLLLVGAAGGLQALQPGRLPAAMWRSEGHSMLVRCGIGISLPSTLGLVCSRTTHGVRNR